MIEVLLFSILYNSNSIYFRINSVRYCNALNSTLFDKCHAKVDPKYYYDACRLDMCECPGDQCHCEVLTAYARECERAGNLRLYFKFQRQIFQCYFFKSFRDNNPQLEGLNRLPECNLVPL